MTDRSPSSIVTAIDGDRATIRLNRPSARNALRMSDWQALADAVTQVGSRTPRVILVTGTGSSFSAGADLGELATLADDVEGRTRFRVAMRAALDGVGAAAAPTVAFINGDCHGAGVALAMACDVRIAAPTAHLSMPPARLGIVYPQADVDRLGALTGRGQAARLLLSGMVVDAAEAARIRLVDEVADSADAWCAAVCTNAASSVAILRRQIGTAALADADRLFDDAFGSAEFTRRIAALRPKDAVRPADERIDKS